MSLSYSVQNCIDIDRRLHVLSEALPGVLDSAFSTRKGIALSSCAKKYTKDILKSFSSVNDTIFFEDMSTQTVTLKQVTWDQWGQDTLSGIVTVTPAVTPSPIVFELSGEVFNIQGFRDVNTFRFSYSGSQSSQYVKDLFQPGALLTLRTDSKGRQSVPPQSS